jgi:putative ABC transport system permease protein
MSYALSTLWFERQRYLPGILAVAFSALLIAVQFGLLLGLFSITSLPIDRTRADIWMGAPLVASVDLGRAIRESDICRLAAQPEVEQVEEYLQGFAYWAQRNGKSGLCMVVASRLGKNSLGVLDALTEKDRVLLQEPGAVIIDESDKASLGIEKIGDTAEVSGVRVRVVGFTRGIRSLAGPYVFCSKTTGRPLLRLLPDQVTYVLAKTKPGANPHDVVTRLSSRYRDVSVMVAADFSSSSQWYWLLKTKAGIALGYAAVLGLLVGAVVTSQTLYAATAASLKEFAVLRALGIPRWRMAALVMSQSAWVGVIGVCLALPTAFAMARLTSRLGVQVLLPWQLLVTAVVVTLVMAIGSGVFALRSLRGVEPATLLR